MNGFFTTKQTESNSRPDGKRRTCISCGLFKTASHPQIAPFGKFEKKILILIEKISKSDDDTGRLLSGIDSKFLKTVLKSEGIELERDCLVVPACHCFKPDDINNDDVENCRKRTINIIQQARPRIIISTGFMALYSLIGHRWKKNFDNIQKWRGWTIPDQDLKCWLCPTLGLDEVNDPENDISRLIFEQDIKQALSMLNQPFLTHIEPRIKIIDNLSILYTIKSSCIAIDYETTGLKPHAKGHRIVCAAVAMDSVLCYVFQMPNSLKERKPFIDLLQRIPLMAHNLKFEETWTNVRLGSFPRVWDWDSMLAAHIIDNRQNITSLKFQVYVNFGIIDYDSEISNYLHSVDKSSNGFNRVQELIKTEDGKRKLLTYCGLDAVYEYRLAMKQKQILT